MKTVVGHGENAPRWESVHDLPMSALLLDLVERRGRTGAAEILGVSCHAVTPAPEASPPNQLRTRDGSASEPPLWEQWRRIGAGT